MIARYLMIAPLALLGACGSEPEAVLETVRMTEQTMLQAVASDDVDGIMRNFEDQAAVAGLGGSAGAGKAAIRAAFEQLLAEPGATVELTPELAWAAESGELAVTTATMRYTHRVRGDLHIERMRNQTVWRRDDGVGWKIASFHLAPIFTTNAPRAS